MGTKNRWRLDGQRALVTGGTKGIGRAIVEEFLQLGAAVFVIARHADLLNKRLEEWRKKGYEVAGLAVDVGQIGSVEKVMEAVRERWGSLDILVNNVGTNIRKKARAYTSEEYGHIMQINLHSVFAFCTQAYPLLQQSAQGNVVNIASVAGLLHIKSGAIYGMTKAAMVQLSKNLAVEWAEDGIRVNTVAPWYIQTPLVEEVLSQEAYLQEVLARTPMKKIGEAADVAAAVAFLCLPAAAYVTGQCIAVDGGFSVNGF